MWSIQCTSNQKNLGELALANLANILEYVLVFGIDLCSFSVLVIAVFIIWSTGKLQVCPLLRGVLGNSSLWLAFKCVFIFTYIQLNVSIGLYEMPVNMGFNSVTCTSLVLGYNMQSRHYFQLIALTAGRIFLKISEII